MFGGVCDLPFARGENEVTFRRLLKAVFVIPAVLALCAVSSVSTFGADLQFGAPAVLGALQSDKITEASGLAVSSLTPNVFWTHNDGSRNEIYACRFDGALLGVFNMGKSPNDVEDIATGPGPKAGARYLYMGDIGSNAATRDTVRVYRVREPAVDLSWADEPVTVDFTGVETCRLHYPDGAYNAEALLVDPIEAALFVVTKQVSDARVYRASLADLKDGATAELQFVIALPFPVVSGGDISLDGSLIALRREDFAVAWQRQGLEAVAQAMARPWTEIPVVGPFAGEPNGEALGFLPDGSGYLTVSEGLHQPVYFFPRAAPCSAAPEFMGAPASGPDGLTLTFQSCANATVAVERSADLRAWTEIGTVIASSVVSTFTDAEGAGTRFYRLRQNSGE
jgi:hypothetical protein